MATDQQTICDDLELWSSALLTKSTAGRGSNGKLEAYGIKKLRELILELAVRGKLVPQDPNDEPASVLLKKIAAEKARLIEEGKIKKEKDFQIISEGEIPFDVPCRWEWSRINDVGHDWGQKTPDSNFTYIDVSAIDNNSGVVSSPSVLSASDAPSRARKIVEKGTVIYSTVRPYLKNISVIDEDYLPEPIASTAFAILHPFHDMPGKYFALYFRSPEFVKYVESAQTGIAYPAINDKQFYGGLVPIPPLAEQHRIVDKVDELMALCDQLQQQQTDSIEAHQILVETLLGTLTSVESQQELNEAWTRIADHFDTLFITEHSIDQLKQTILQLAVMGKLVPQDPNDEPASVLLERIAEEKERLVKKGEIRKEKPLPEIAEEEIPCEVPKQWEYARFGWLVNFKSELVKPEDFMDFDQVAPDSIEKGTGKLLNRRTVSESGVGGPNNRFYTGQILYSKIRPSLSKAIIAPFDGLCSADMYPLESMIEAAFLLKAILSEPFLEQVRIAENRIKMPKLNVDSLSRIVVPLPPLSEQHRIVAKVNELMALCDALKARLTDAQTTQIHLADTIVEQAVA